MTRALVLGGGGPVGIAWELGLLAGLAEVGFDPATADRILGTSAGALVGCQIASGRAPAALHADHLDLGHRQRFEDEVRRQPAPDLGPLMAFFMRRPLDALPSAALLMEMGRFALGARTLSEDEFIANVGRLILTGASWPERFACTAVDAETGAFQVWTAGSGVELARAVASSCAVPGLYPPVTIAGRRYIDGGVRSATNADAVAGAEAVLMVAVTVRPVDPFMILAARREAAALETGGSRTALITPDATCLTAFGPDLMDGTRHAAVAAAGLDQGRRQADQLAFWSLG